MDKLLSLREAAAICGLTMRTLQRECAKGTIAGAVQIGRQWCIPASWAEEHRSGDYSATHLTLAEASRISGVSRQGLLDRIDSGAIDGFAALMLRRKRWWVERESFARWLDERKERRGR